MGDEHPMKALPTLVLLLSLTACGGATPEPEPQPQPQPTGPAPSATNTDPAWERSDWGNGLVTGLVRIDDTAKPPAEGFALKLRIDEVAMGGGSKEVAKFDKPLTGAAPYAFEMKANNAASVSTSVFYVNGFIAAPDGEFWYGAKAPVQVFVKGEQPKPIEIVMIPVDPRAKK